MAALVLVALAVLFVLGVRDWRCYGARPALAAGHLGDPDGNVTLWLALAAALAWRFRDRHVRRCRRPRRHARREVLPLAARRLAGRDAEVRERSARAASSAWCCSSPRGQSSASPGSHDYPRSAPPARGDVGDDSYTAYIVGLDLGLPSAVARAALARRRARHCSSASSSRRGGVTSGARSSSRSRRRSPSRRSSGSTTSRCSSSSWRSRGRGSGSSGSSRLRWSSRPEAAIRRRSRQRGRSS